MSRETHNESLFIQIDLDTSELIMMIIVKVKMRFQNFNWDHDTHVSEPPLVYSSN